MDFSRAGLNRTTVRNRLRRGGSNMGTRHLTALEHESLPIGEGGVTSTEAEYLTLLGERLPGLVYRGLTAIRLAQYCGVIHLGERALGRGREATGRNGGWVLFPFLIYAAINVVAITPVRVRSSMSRAARAPAATTGWVAVGAPVWGSIPPKASSG